MFAQKTNKQDPEALFPYISVLRLGFRPGQEPQLVWIPCVPHLAHCLIKGRRDRGRWWVKTPLPRGSFKVGCHHVPEKEPALCCLVRISKLSPWSGGWGVGDHDLEMQAAAHSYSCSEILGKALKLWSLRFHSYSDSDDNSHLTERLKGWEESL